MSSTEFVASRNSLVLRNTVIAAIVTIALNLVVYFIGEQAGWIPADLPAGADSFGIPAMIISTLIPIIGGGIVLTLLIHTTTHPVRMFCLIAAVVFIVTLVAPLSVAGASMSFRSFLVALHVITAAVGTVILIRNVAEETQHY